MLAWRRTGGRWVGGEEEEELGRDEIEVEEAEEREGVMGKEMREVWRASCGWRVWGDGGGVGRGVGCWERELERDKATEASNLRVSRRVR